MSLRKWHLADLNSDKESHGKIVGKKTIGIANRNSRSEAKMNLDKNENKARQGGCDILSKG